jgi:hypothetical protein
MEERYVNVDIIKIQANEGSEEIFFRESVI